MDILAFGTPFGLAFASGLNAYLPMLAFTLSVRWLHLYKVNPNFAFITSNWFIAALVILTILDFVADKIPLLDHGWDAIHTVVRPLAGAVVAAASSQYTLGMHSTAFTGYASSGIVMAAFSSTITVTGLGLLAVLLIGGVLAALMHTTKSTTRLVSTLTTAGFLNIGLSVAEDILVVIVILLSLFASSIMFILLVLLVLILVPRLIHSRWRQ
ncbi:MAG: DUF4126 domain-containing protein [Ktedonobacteraceae bacterium]